MNQQTSNNYGAYMDQSTIRFERVLPGPIERVWAYLTDPEKRGKWLASGAMELKVGGRVQLDFMHSKLTRANEPTPERYKAMECGVSLFGKVTRVEPPRLLAYTWGEGGGRESEVTFELTPQGDKVLLLLTHRRLAGREELLSVAAGWHTHLGILEDNLSEQEPRPFWSTHARLEKEYEPRLPKSVA